MSYHNKAFKHGPMAVLFVLALLYSTLIYAQAHVKANCLQPYELDFNKNSAEVFTEKQIKFTDHDDHTFWYQLNTAEAEKFSYTFNSLDQQDNFDIYFYEYQGNNFCRNLIQENLELISFNREVEIKTNRQSSYYLGVYPLFPGGCGHQIEFTYGKSTLILRSENSERDCGLKTDEEIIQELPDDSRILINGYVFDEITGNNINAQLNFVDPFTGHELLTHATEEYGFSVALAKDGDYKVLIQSFGYKDLITALAAYEGDSHKFGLNWSGKKSYVLNNVYFYPNTYALKEESEKELFGVYSYLKNRDHIHVEIVGHTNGDKDVKASKMVNQKGEEWNFTGSARELSLHRAHKIAKFLESKGIDSRMMEAKGLGGDQMIIPDPANMKEAMQNIRVEIKIISD